MWDMKVNKTSSLLSKSLQLKLQIAFEGVVEITLERVTLAKA